MKFHLEHQDNELKENSGNFNFNLKFLVLLFFGGKLFGENGAESRKPIGWAGEKVDGDYRS